MYRQTRTWMYRDLLSPFSLSDELILNNRIVMAPMTRCFADDDLAPTEQAISYYARRADAGLIITEATLINPLAQGYPRTPGIYSAKQVAAWRKITYAVHERGGRIFCQLWHTGRLAHSHYTGHHPTAPSNVGLEGPVPRSPGLLYEVPRALTARAIEQLVRDYAVAACNAMDAGFDGVEIHGANGYLIDQFLRQQTNHRSDRYGGAGENRIRFPLEVVDAVGAAVGNQHTAIRLSPQAHINLEHTDGDEVTFMLLLNALETRSILYVHLGAFDASMTYPYLEGTPTGYLRRCYGGTIIGCGSFDPETAELALQDWQIDLAAFGRTFIANPDLVRRITTGQSLTRYDESMLATLY